MCKREGFQIGIGVGVGIGIEETAEPALNPWGPICLGIDPDSDTDPDVEGGMTRVPRYRKISIQI